MDTLFRGFILTMMEGIIGHCKDDTTVISKEDECISFPQGTMRLRTTTLGCKLLSSGRMEVHHGFL